MTPHPLRRPARLALGAAVLATGFAATTAQADAKKPLPAIDFKHGHLRVTGGAADDKVVLRVPAARPSRLEVDLGDDGSSERRIVLRRIDRITVATAGGADSIRVEDAVSPLQAAVTLDGGDDADTLLGGSAEEFIVGGAGDDAADGGRGDDVAFLGSGEDTFGWDPGEGSDVVEGQAGEDQLAFRGSAGAEKFDLSPNGTRARLFRDVGTITMDLASVETVATSALGGADTMTVHPIGDTGVTNVDTDFAGAVGGKSGDGATDRLVLAGTDDEDFVSIFGSATSAAVLGLPVFARSRHTDAEDAIEIRAGDADDRISASSLPASAPRLTVDAGDGDDDVQTGAGDDSIHGGDGTDFVDPNGGDDIAMLGADPDSLRWDPGDGSDVAEGGGGTDSMLFLGNAAAERFAIAPNGQRIRFTRDVGAITMDLGGIERLETNAFQGADTFDVEDLSGTGVTQVDMALSGVPASPANDGQVDRVTVKGTSGDDAMAVKGANGAVTLTGLPARIGIARAEGAFDQLRIEGLGGTDTLDASGLAPNAIGLAFVQ